MDKNTPDRLTRWMLPHEQPQRLPIEHEAQEDIAWAAGEISRLTNLLNGYLNGQEWARDLPDEQADYWWWNEDKDSPPILVSIMYSGANHEYFASNGQHGWTTAQWVRDMGGFWMKALIPDQPSI